MREGKKQQRRHILGAWALGCAATLAGSPARADPTREECFDANEAAQALRAAGKVREAQDKLGLCASHGCPGPVRKDCTERLDEVQKALPTVVFAVRSARGDDMTSVRVRMDGAVLPATLGGGATPVDPGSHEFTFEAEGFATLKEQILVREAEKERGVSVVLQPAEEPRPSPAGAAPQSPAPGPALGAASPQGGDGSAATRRWIAIAVGGLGVVGLGVGGGIALAAKSQFNTAEGETGRHATRTP
jgi:hypothetical protein